MSEKYSVKYIGKNIKYLRKNVLKMTQEEFSERTDSSKDTISNIERGRYHPSIQTLINISNLTDTTVDYFLKKR